MAFAQDENRLSPYRKLLLELSSELSNGHLEKLKFASIDLLPRGTLENITSGLKFFDVLEQDGRIAPLNLSLLEDMFKTIGRMDLAEKIQCFSASYPNNDSERIRSDVDCDATEPHHVDIDNDVVPDGGGDEPERGQAAAAGNKTTREFVMDQPMEESREPHVAGPFSCFSVAPAVRQTLLDSAPTTSNTSFGQDQGFSSAAPTSSKSFEGNNGSSSKVRGPAPTAVPASTSTIAPAAYSQAQTGQQSRLQGDPSVEPPPVHYVNYLAYQGYSVEIFGGKHFKTPEGEFVEMKSGTQYKILVKNSRAYGCNLDVSIDGYDVGGWVVDGGQELTIERPAYEAKKFTFYRVKTAPKEAGIESGRSENGLVKCVFTPEVFLDVPVVIPGLPQPLKVNVAPSARVGDLKREVQSQLNATPDPDQILVYNEQFVLSNFTRLSVLKSPGNLRLIDAVMQITVETSSSEIFSVEIQPGKANVYDLMEQIERKLGVPIKDQKLFHGKTRLSDAPRSDLPLKLICSLQPTVVVIVPEFISVTVNDIDSGASRIVKIDKEKKLRDLMTEMPSCRRFSKNEKVTVNFDGKEISPYEDDRSLASLGISSGSKLDLKITKDWQAPQDERELASLGTSSGSNLELKRDKQMNPKEKTSFLSKIKDKIRSSKKSQPLSESDLFRSKTTRRPDDINYGDMDDINYGDMGATARAPRCSTARASRWPPLQGTGSSDDESYGLGEFDDEVAEFDNEAAESAEEGPRGTSSAGIKAKASKQFHRVKGTSSAGPRGTSSAGIKAKASKQFHHVKGTSSAGISNAAMSSRNEENDLEEEQRGRVLTENDPAWKAGGTTLQGHSTQQFITAEPIKVDPSKKVELVLRLVAREDETDLVFPKDEFKPLSTLYPPAVPE